jgi:hypothetical protein
VNGGTRASGDQLAGPVISLTDAVWLDPEESVQVIVTVSPG